MEKEKQRKLSAQDISENDEKILLCLRQHTVLMGHLEQLELLLYDQGLDLPRPLFRLFRAVRDKVEAVAGALHDYVSPNHHFVAQKDAILQEQIALAESQLTKTNSKGLGASGVSRGRRSEARGDQSDTGVRNQVQLLRLQVQALKNELRRNDAYYEVEIKKYNLKYEEMQSDINYYQDKMGEVEEYVDTIHQLETEVLLLKEIKQRDEQLLRNMARKIKNYELQKGGRLGLGSPPRLNHTILSPSRIGSHLSPSRLRSHFSPSRQGSAIIK